MIKYIKKFPILATVLFHFMSCVSQTTVLTVENKSDYIIDSFFLPDINKSIVDKIKPGETKEVKINNSEIPSYMDGSLGVWLYRSDNRVLGSTFSYDEFSINERPPGSYMFVYNNGIQGIEKEPSEPKEFELYLSKSSEIRPDSVTTNFLSPPQRCYKDFKDSAIYIKLPFKDFKENPTLNIHYKNKKYSLFVSHDWEIWNTNIEIYCLKKNGSAERDISVHVPKR